jgi:ABC-type multidrug transport system fused ATPase/permease subunit
MIQSRPGLTVGVGMFICTFIYMYAWVYTAEVTSKRIRERYLRAILRQDIAFFDKVGPGEITTRIQSDTRMWFFFFFDSCPESGYRRKHRTA